MSNTLLTIEPKKSNSHGQIWMPFIVKVIKILQVYPNSFHLWGQSLEKKS